MKTYREWLLNEKNLSSSVLDKFHNNQITFEDVKKFVKKRGHCGPLIDIYNRMCKFELGFPWNADYQTMIKAIKKENKEEVRWGEILGKIEDIDGFLKIFRISLILYDLYKSKRYKDKYEIDVMRWGIYGGFGDEEDYIFEEIRKAINSNKNKYTRGELMSLRDIYHGNFHKENRPIYDINDWRSHYDDGCSRSWSDRCIELGRITSEWWAEDHVG